MKGKDTRGYPHWKYTLLTGCSWLKVDFDDGGKPGYPEKNRCSQLEIEWNSADIYDLAAEGHCIDSYIYIRIIL